MTIDIILADDHKILRHGLKTALDKEPDMSVVAEAEDGRATLKLVRKHDPHVVLMDINMPDLNGIDATRQIVTEFPYVKVIGLSTHIHKRYVVGMLEAGASGFLPKTCSFVELKGAIKNVADGKTYLSPDIAGLVIEKAFGPANDDAAGALSELTSREREVLQLVAEGYTSREIAGKLFISGKTVETHRRQIMNKLKLHSIAELTKFAIREGITDLET